MIERKSIGKNWVIGKNGFTSDHSWMKEQFFYFNVNGLELNATNEFGSVNANDLVVYLNNLTDYNIGIAEAGTIDYAPILNTDSIEVGKKSIDFVSQDELQILDIQDEFDWNTAMSFSTRISIPSTQTSNDRTILSIGDIASGGSQDEIRFTHSNGEIGLLVRHNNVEYKKILTTGASINNGNWHKITIEYAGTNDIADCKIYINDVLQSTTVLLNTSLLGISLTLSRMKLMITTENVARLIGSLGSMILAKGKPNFNQLAKYI